jgi:hypothetical protein
VGLSYLKAAPGIESAFSLLKPDPRQQIEQIGFDELPGRFGFKEGTKQIL